MPSSSGAFPSAPPTPNRLSQRTRVAAAAVLAVLLTLGVAQAALTGLQRVEAASRAAERVDGVRSRFQDADMMHDALQSAVLGAVLGDDEVEDPAQEVRDAAERFRDDLRVVAEVPLPVPVRRDLTLLRPAQEQYVADAERLVAAGPAAPAADLSRFREAFVVLRTEQDRLTRVLAAEADDARRAEADSRRAAELRLLGTAAVATLGLAGLGLWLSRAVGRLHRLARHDRGVAETLQRMLLPDVLPDLPGVSLAARYVPGDDASLVGGDWYDVLVLPGGEVGLAMGDVAGHDLQAAVRMGQLRHALRAYATQGLAPAAVLQRLNDLCLSEGDDTMATCVYAVLDPVAPSLTVVSAGHVPVVVRGPAGAHCLRGAPRPPLGAVRTPAYEQVTHPLEPGSAVLLYTDGLVERRDEALETGLDRLLAAVEGGPADLAELCAHVVARSLDGSGSRDDVALLAVEPRARLGEELRLSFLAEPGSLARLRRVVERWLQEAGASDAEAFDLLVATSEAASNAVEHAYGPGQAHFELHCVTVPGGVEVSVRDWGTWRPPRGRDRGRGLALIRCLVDDSDVVHGPHGTVVRLRRALGTAAAARPGAAAS